jgi:uncharacterized membrane protein
VNALQSYLRPLVASAAVLLAGACATQPPLVETEPTPAMPDVQVYAYPARGQSEQQLDRDRFECHLWAVRESGFDPSLPATPPGERVRVVRETAPGSRVAAGAAAGAVVGAITSAPEHAGEHAVAGAVVGALLGAAADADAAARERRTAARAADAVLTARADAYRRAIGACLAGRGYSVN